VLGLPAVTVGSVTTIYISYLPHETSHTRIYTQFPLVGYYGYRLQLDTVTRLLVFRFVTVTLPLFPHCACCRCSPHTFYGLVCAGWIRGPRFRLLHVGCRYRFYRVEGCRFTVDLIWTTTRTPHALPFCQGRSRCWVGLPHCTVPCRCCYFLCTPQRSCLHTRLWVGYPRTSLLVVGATVTLIVPSLVQSC